MNCSDSAGYYVWDFGDDSTSFEENPTHTCTSPGTYRVVLLANNEPVIDYNADGLINTLELTETTDTTSRIVVVGAGSEAANYISFKGTKYALNYGQFWSVSEFETDVTGRYHEIILTDNCYKPER